MNLQYHTGLGHQLTPIHALKHLRPMLELHFTHSILRKLNRILIKIMWVCVPGSLLLAVGAEEAEGGPAAAEAPGDAAVLLRRVHAGLHRALLVIRHTVGGHPEHLHDSHWTQQHRNLIYPPINADVLKGFCVSTFHWMDRKKKTFLLLTCNFFPLPRRVGSELESHDRHMTAAWRRPNTRTRTHTHFFLVLLLYFPFKIFLFSFINSSVIVFLSHFIIS